MKTVTVLYFAAIRDLVGVGEETIEISEDSTIEVLVRQLVGRHSVLDGRLGSVRFAKNEEFAPEDARLDDGDVVALIPPVAGG